jgi:hypothetical protein
MFSLKIRIYLFYVAAIFFAALGMWLIGGGLFGGGGLKSLVIGGLMFATGVVDYVMGNNLRRTYLQPSAPAVQAAPAVQPDSSSTGSPGGSAG